jgi:dTMP kinase
VDERLLKLLDNGSIVLLDRFIDSSLAYQGAGRRLGVEEVRAINLFATFGLQADRTLLLLISPSEARARQGERGLALDRLELGGEEFFDAVAAAYDELARVESGRIRVLDATRSPQELLGDALAAIEDLLAPASEEVGA